MSTPGHHCDVVVLGDVLGWVRSPSGHLTGIVIALDIDTPTTVPVLLSGGVHGLHKGDRVAIRGTLVAEKSPGQSIMLYVKPRPGGFEILKRRNGHG
jgi:hypothetical protein